MKSHCVRTETLAPSLKLEPVRLLNQKGHIVKKGVRKQIHACCMNKNHDSLTQHYTASGQVAEMAKRCTPSQTDVIFPSHCGSHTTLPVLDCLLSGCNVCRAEVWRSNSSLDKRKKGHRLSTVAAAHHFPISSSPRRPDSTKQKTGSFPLNAVLAPT